MIFDSDKNEMDIFNNMGFTKQQTHAVLNLSVSDDFTYSNGPYIYRRSNEHDQAEMNGFSRLIAEYQTQSPCFASAPLKYLETLDEGFSNIATDPEIDLFVGLRIQSMNLMPSSCCASVIALTFSQRENNNAVSNIAFLLVLS